MQSGNEKLSIHEHRFEEPCSQNDPHDPMGYELANYKC
jgi:hypothetical protein